MQTDLIYVFDEQERLSVALANKEDDDGDNVFWDAYLDRDLEGKYNFHFKTGKSGDHIDYMMNGYKVGIFDRDQRFQVFDIISPEDERSHRRTISVKSRHIFHELLDAERIMDKRPTNTSFRQALEQALEDVPNWKVGEVDDLGNNSTNYYRENPLASIQKASDVWNGELDYYVELNGGQIGDRVLEGLNRLGQDRGAILEVGHNAKEIKRKINRKGVKTAMYAWGKGEEVKDDEGESTGGYGRRITIEDLRLSEDDGDDFNKPEGQPYVADETALQRFGRWVNGQLVHRFGDFEDDQEDDPKELAKSAWEELQKTNEPEITYEGKAIDLEKKTDEFGVKYRAHVYRLGDDVAVMDTHFKPELRVKARIKKENDPFPFGISDEERDLSLGNFIRRVSDRDRLDEVAQKVGDNFGVWNDKVAVGDSINTSVLEGAINALNNEIESTGGYVYLTDSEGLSIYDRPRDEDPTQVINLMGGSMRIANEKDRNGNWAFKTFGTGDGFTAELLTAGQIMTSLIRIVGDAYFFWDESNITIADPDNSQKQMRIGLFDGENYGIGFTTNGGRTWNTSIDFNGVSINQQANYTDGYNPRDNEEAAFEGIGVDYGGNPPNFSRETEAYDYDMNRFESDEPVLSHGGMLLQHRTENLLRNPDFSELDDEGDPNPDDGEGGGSEEGSSGDDSEGSSDTSYDQETEDAPDNSVSRINSDDDILGWTRGNWYGSTNRNQVEGISPYSRYCLRLERWNGREDTTSSIYSWGMNVDGGEIYSLTFMVFAPRNDICEVSIRDSTNLEHHRFEFIGTGRWERMEFYQRLNASCEEARIYLFNNKAENRIHYYSNVMFSKGYPSAYAEGEREKDLLTIGARHVFRKDKGCFEIKGVVPTVLDQTIFNMIIDENIEEGTEENRFSLSFTEKGEVKALYGSSQNEIVSPGNTLRAYAPFNVALNWSDERSQWELWVDGKKIGAKAFTEPEAFPEDVEINEDHVLILQDLRISKKARRDDELREGGNKVYVGNATNIRRRGYQSLDQTPDNEE